MAFNLRFSKKGSSILKSPKKSTGLSRTGILKLTKQSTWCLRILLMFSIVCVVFICYAPLSQNSGNSTERLSSVELVKSCKFHSIEPSEKPFLHYPKPKTFSREECSCNPVRYFAIFSIQRSGSGWFETLLNSHINISSNGEIFSVKPRRANASTVIETLDKLYNLDFLTSASKHVCTAAVGLKWMLNQGVMQHNEEILEYFMNRGVSIIFFLRRNLLRRMISELANSYDRTAKLLNGTHKAHVHSIKDAEILARYKPTINSAMLIANLRQAEEMVTKALEYFKGTRHIVIYYEDMIKNRTKSVDAQDFLRVPRMELTSHHVKIHRGPLYSLVENWADVREALKGTSYEHFLQED